LPPTITPSQQLSHFLKKAASSPRGSKLAEPPEEAAASEAASAQGSARPRKEQGSLQNFFFALLPFLIWRRGTKILKNLSTNNKCAN